jgi:hypothetical protein
MWDIDGLKFVAGADSTGKENSWCAKCARAEDNPSVGLDHTFFPMVHDANTNGAVSIKLNRADMRCVQAGKGVASLWLCRLQGEL